MLLSIAREGHFYATNMRANPHKCAAMRTRTYKYNVMIEGTDSRLSPEGYLFNNERVQDYFDNRFGEHAPEWEAMSCENMARTAAREIADILARDGIDVRCVECLIVGSNEAQIKAIWRPEFQLPESSTEGAGAVPHIGEREEGHAEVSSAIAQRV